MFFCNKVRIFKTDHELILDEQSAVAIDNRSRMILSYGDKATEFFQKNPESSKWIFSHGQEENKAAKARATCLGSVFLATSVTDPLKGPQMIRKRIF